MANELVKDDKTKVLAAALIKGDLDQLSDGEKIQHLNAVCDSLGLNVLTNPFEYIKMGGKLRLYAKRDATDQLRKINKVSVKITSREMVGDCYVVTAEATFPDGRIDESVGAVSVGGLKGEALANKFMVAETKAKRRVTLSICGLGLLDETEVDSVTDAHKVALPKPPPVSAPTNDPTEKDNREFLKNSFKGPSKGPKVLVMEAGQRLGYETEQIVRMIKGVIPEYKEGNTFGLDQATKIIEYMTDKKNKEIAE